MPNTSQVINLEELPPTALLKVEQVAPIFGITAKCLRSWYGRGQGPRITRLGSRAIRYTAADCLSFLAASADKAANPVT